MMALFHCISSFCYHSIVSLLEGLEKEEFMKQVDYENRTKLVVCALVLSFAVGGEICGEGQS